MSFQFNRHHRTPAEDQPVCLETLEPRLLLAGDIAVTVSSLATFDTTPELTGTVSDDEAAIQVTVNGLTYDSSDGVVNNGNGTWTLPDGVINPALGEDTYDVVVLATNSDEGTSGLDDTTDELEINLTDLQITIDEIGTSDSTPTLTGGISEATASIQIIVEGDTYGATNNGDGTWTLDAPLPVLDDGTYDVIAIAINGDDTATDDTTDELVIDTVVPEVAVDELTTSDRTPVLTGTLSETDVTVEVTVDGVTYSSETGDVLIIGVNDTWSIPNGVIDPLLADGTYDVAVTVTDRGGNDATDATTDELTIEGVPAVTINIPEGEDQIVTRDDTPELTGTVDYEDVTITVEVDGITYDVVAPLVDNDDGTWTWTLADNTIDPLDDDIYDVVVTATNDNGDGTDDTQGELLIDTMPPTVAVNTLATKDTTPELTGTVNDDESPITVRVVGEGVDVTHAGTNNGDGTWTLADDTLAALAEGTYEVIVTVEDELGNVGTDNTTDELTIRLIPIVTFDALTTNSAEPTLTGTVSDDEAVITVTIDGVDYEATNNEDGTWTLDLTGTPLAEGTYEVLVAAVNENGTGTNEPDPEDEDPPSNELIVDLTAPGELTVDPLTTTYTNPRLSGTDDDQTATITVTVGGQEATAVNNGNGIWTLEEGSFEAGLGTGIHDVTVMARDAANNLTTDATTDELRIMERFGIGITCRPGAVRSIGFTDPDGTRVKISIRRGTSVGFANVFFDSYSLITDNDTFFYKRGVLSDAGVVISEIQIIADTVAIVITTSGGTMPGTTLGGIGGASELKNLNARGVDLVGFGIDMSGVIRSISLRSVQANIAMSGYTRYGVRFNIAQQVRNSNIILSDSRVNSFRAGSMINSSLTVGVMGLADAEPEGGDGVVDLPDVADLREGLVIRNVRIAGYRGAEGALFQNSNIAADVIGTVSLRDATLDNNGTAFGVTANSLRRLTLRQSRTNYVWGRNWLPLPLDFEVRLV